MSKVGDSPYVRVTPASSKGDSREQGQSQGQNQGQGQGQGQEQGQGNGGAPSDVHSKAAASWQKDSFAPGDAAVIKGNIGGTVQGKGTVHVKHNLPDGTSRSIDKVDMHVNPGGAVLTGWTVKNVAKPEGTVSFEIKTENGTFKGSEFRLKAPIKG